MRVKVSLRSSLALAACGLLAMGCDQFMQEDTSEPVRKPRPAASAPAKPTGSATAQKTCKETFRLEPGDARYDRCIASLTDLEAK